MSERTSRRHHRPRSHDPLGGSFCRHLGRPVGGRSGIPDDGLSVGRRFEMPGEVRRPAAHLPGGGSLQGRVPTDGPVDAICDGRRRDAWADAGAPDVDPIRFGVAVGTGMGGLYTLLGQWDILKGVRRVFLLAVPMLMPNSPAIASSNFGARAGATTVSPAPSGAGVRWARPTR